MSKIRSHFQRIFFEIIFLLVLVSGCNSTGTGKDPMSVHSSGTVHANNLEIAYESFGPEGKEVILLIGGTGGQLIDWPIELVQELVKRGYRVVMFDNRDAGLSSKITEAGYPDFAAVVEAINTGKSALIPYTLNDMAADTVGLLDGLQIKKAHFVGASMGGAIGQIVALQYPDRVLSFTSIMADSGNPNLPMTANPQLLATIPSMPAEGDKAGYIEYQVKSLMVIGSPKYPTEETKIRKQVTLGVERAYEPIGLMRQQVASLMAHLGDRHTRLKDIHTPTVVLQGTDDPIVSVESAREIAANIPGAELILVEGMGHDLPVQLVDTFADAIINTAKRAAK